MNYPCAWPSPERHPELGVTEAHLWYADLRQPDELVRALGGMLSFEEHFRADRFRFERDRRRYIVSHGLLRQMLGRYLDVDGHDLVFRTGHRGKPSLPESENMAQLQFNLSHSADDAVYVFARSRRVGIDLEYIRPIPEADDLVDRLFPPEERRRYHRIHAGQRVEAFFQLWTGREALLKALGLGLTDANPLVNTRTLDGHMGRTPDLQDSQPPGAWTLHTFRPTHTCMGTVALEGAPCSLKYYCASPRSLLDPDSRRCVSAFREIQVPT